MTEQLINCKRCGSNACSEISNGIITIYVCMGCGFTSNTTITNKNVSEMESTLPELYKALRYKDEDGKYWYPNSVVLEDKSMVFAEGTSVDDWKWSAVQAKDGKADMTTKKEFEQNDFLEALDYIQYFQQARSFL
jgi:DNA-directed RNA polymerase subunit RPC12/RpoP